MTNPTNDKDQPDASASGDALRVEDIAARTLLSRGYDINAIRADHQKSKKLKMTHFTKKVAPKFMNPDNHDQLWSGRGKQPTWFKEAIAAGKTLEELTIKMS